MNGMTKKQLLAYLEQVDDDAIIYVETEEEIYKVQRVYVISDEDIPNKVTLYCY